jgi:phage shock protein PspC (stress-responsive transcriptional regulator)
MNRRSLYRCRHDRKLAGVASGLAEFFDLDVSLVRILWILSIFVGGMGILLFIVMAIIVPLEPEYIPAPGGTTSGEGAPGAEGDPAVAGMAPVDTAGIHSGWHTTYVPHQHQTGGGSGIGVTFFGALLIIFGALALIDGYLPDWADSGRFLWPAFILAVGALLVAAGIRRRPTEP